jgi:hypothetical protein
MLYKLLLASFLALGLVPGQASRPTAGPDRITCCEKHMDCCHRGYDCCTTPRHKPCCATGSGSCKHTSACCKTK